MPRFSIVMPVYNNERYFPIAVQSVIDQDFQDFELIIVDDGSTDDTANIADRMSERDSRIKVVHQQNQWIYASFNRGIREASGDYVYILNSDDRMRRGSLALMNSKVEEFFPDVILTKVVMHLCDSEQKIIEYDQGGGGDKTTQDKFYCDEKVLHQAWPFFFESKLIFNQANLYKRDIMLKHPFRNDVYGADVFFNIDIASDIKTAYVLATPVYDFYIYNREEMNASCGKYYEYEHDMLNEIHDRFVTLFASWKLEKKTYELLLGKWRVHYITKEIRALQVAGCPLKLEEKIKRIFTKYIDVTVYTCAERSNLIEELESRVLSGVREILINEELPRSSEMYFVYELIEALSRYEKTGKDYGFIIKALNHTMNPYSIGQAFWKKLKDKDTADLHRENM